RQHEEDVIDERSQQGEHEEPRVAGDAPHFHDGLCAEGVHAPSSWVIATKASSSEGPSTTRSVSGTSRPTSLATTSPGLSSCSARRDSTSMPTVGSSRNSSSGSDTIACAKKRRCLLPCDRPSARR